ncbi:GMC family oxidoreductase [Neorhizobium sp. T7_12]|uniref:GMC family oxidoreductase n=1 Tax=Neorhizobium sp. T7_12 TaxID=2093832 RepID=UPI000CF9814E|nr:GMC family oxidoreductase N-terminal domain-containing protein [Neorhizobium sp. T7_12]
MKRERTDQTQSRDAGTRQDAIETAFLGGAISRRRFVATSLALGLLTVGRIDALADTLQDIKDNQAARAKKLSGSYDYVVCGAGSAACALVGRLAADRSKRILVIEAGGWDDVSPILDPHRWFTNFGTERAYSDFAPPSPTVNNRSVLETTGRALGGGSSINACVWERPFKNDFDFWAQEAKDEKWDYEHALAIFRRIENWQGKPNPHYRGTGGPVWCQEPQNPSSLASAMLDACRALNLPMVEDANGIREVTGEGFGYMNQIIREGQRQNMAKSFLYPVLAQKNVTLLVDTRVDRLVVKWEKVSSVSFVRDGTTSTIVADSEVILCCGGINTPHLLMLSGIGDENHLKAVGIDPVLHSPEVGKNFQDHVLHGGCLWEASGEIQMANTGTEVIGYLKSDPSLDRPDISLVQVEMPYATDVLQKQYAPSAKSWALSAAVVTPKSRGHVRLKSGDPAERPMVEPNFLDHPDDLKALGHSIELCREIGNSAPMRSFTVREVMPGRKLEGKEQVDFMRNGATSYSHASGTCRMGTDAGAVVDADLRVNGLRNLRIADSSIMPRISASATMAACVYIGERMAEILTPPR